MLVSDYHQDILNLSLQEFSRPDVVNIAETADASDLGRLLQLVLSKSNFVPNIDFIILIIICSIFIVISCCIIH